MNKKREFELERSERVNSYKNHDEFIKLGKSFLEESMPLKYSYNFSWLGRPIIQYPQDIIAMQEIIWDVKPDLIIETGIAHGGSLILYASILELIGNGKVLGIDIDIREHNQKEIEEHSMNKRIIMLEGSSVSEEIFKQVEKFCTSQEKILVCLDSNHTHDHVLKELEFYSQFVSINSYLVIFDTLIEDIPDEYSKNRPWGVGSNPKTAVHEFLKNRDDFVIDRQFENKMIITTAPDGFLKRVK